MSEVERYYDEHAEREWNRLERHRTEFAVTMRALAEYLPKPPARILDIGGGPGRYAISLARQGYEVTLSDLSQANLALGKVRAAEAGVALAGYVHANALDLSVFPDAAFDAALLMGPLYHLLQDEDRRQAIREARRVLKDGGLLFATFICRYAPLRDAAKYNPDQLTANRDLFQGILETGVMRVKRGSGFTDTYFAHPAEIVPLLEGSRFTTLDLIAAEGVVSMIEEKVNELQGEAWEAWVELNYRLGRDPSVHGCAEHLLYVGRK